MSTSSFHPFPGFSPRLLLRFRSTTVRARRGSSPVRAAESAWRILRLCAIGIESRAAGWCIGPVGPQELEFAGTRLQRVPVHGAAARRRTARLGRLHQAAGHDPCCRAIGVPADALHPLITHWSPPGCAEFLAEAVHEAVAVIGRAAHDGGWSRMLAREAVEAALSDRISIRAPSGSEA